MSFSGLGEGVPVEDLEMDEEEDEEDEEEEAEEEAEDHSTDVDAEAAEFLRKLGLGADGYVRVIFHAEPRVNVEVVLQVGNSYINFAGSECNISPTPLMGRIRALVEGGGWKMYPDHAEISRPYGASDDFYLAMCAKSHSFAKFIVPNVVKMLELTLWAGHNRLQYVIRGDRLFIRFVSFRMQLDFERENGVHTCMVHEEGDAW